MQFSEGKHEWEEVQTSLKVGVEYGKLNFTSLKDTILGQWRCSISTSIH